MPERGIRSTYSQCPFEIQMWDHEGVISTGTAFFYEVNEEWFLITNWHNLSGRHFLTDKPLSSSGRLPTFIKAKFSQYSRPESGYPADTFVPVAQRVDIYHNYDPLWLEHPDLGPFCDVVALPMSRPSDCPSFMHNAANRISSVKIPVEPGCTVYIIGFPRSISVGFGLPLWKSGYIASEPYYDVTIDGRISEVGGLHAGTTLPAFFLDSLTREGMSGSPVFASYTGNWDTSDPYRSWNPNEPGFYERDDIYLGTEAKEFVGCYSARVGGKEEGAALGLCWRKDVIEYICSSKQIGTTHTSARELSDLLRLSYNWESVESDLVDCPVSCWYADSDLIDRSFTVSAIPPNLRLMSLRANSGHPSTKETVPTVS